MACSIAATQKPVDPAALHGSAVAVLRVAGMGCGNCANRVRNSLLSVSGVLAAQVDLGEGVVRVNFAPNGTELQHLLDAVADAGNDGHHQYRATLIEATW